MIKSNDANEENKPTVSNVKIPTAITVTAIARYCLVSKSTVRRWIMDEKLSAIKLPSGHFRITVEDFKDFLKRYNMPIREEIFESKS
jgi:excisionase family DNA binding protein